MADSRAGGNAAPHGLVYLLAAIGAAVYFVGQADGFWGVVLGLLKALVWPAFLVYHGLDALGA